MSTIIAVPDKFGRPCAVVVATPPKRCSNCDGGGAVRKLIPGFGSVETRLSPCVECAGTGISVAAPPAGFVSDRASL